MKTVSFVFSRPLKKKIFSELIMFFCGTNYSHASTMFKSDRWQCEFFYQASGSATNFMGGYLFNQINSIVEHYELDIEDGIEESVGKLCVSREGKKYALLQTIGQGIIRVFKFFGKTIDNPFLNGDAESNCIEEQYYLIAKGLGLDVGLEIENIDIKTYRDFISSLPGVRRVK